MRHPIQPSHLHSHDRELDRRVTVLETRFDLILPNLVTKADLAKFRAEMRADMATFKAELRAETVGFRGDMRTEASRFETKIQRWMIATIITLFVSQAATGFAIVTILRPA